MNFMCLSVQVRRLAPKKANDQVHLRDEKFTEDDLVAKDSYMVS